MPSRTSKWKDRTDPDSPHRTAPHSLHCCLCRPERQAGTALLRGPRCSHKDPPPGPQALPAPAATAGFAPENQTWRRPTPRMQPLTRAIASSSFTYPIGSHSREYTATADSKKGARRVNSLFSEIGSFFGLQKMGSGPDFRKKG